MKERAGVVELSLHERFRRGYSALYRAIEALGESVIPQDPSELLRTGNNSFPPSWISAIAQVVPAPKQRDYWLFGVDVTPVPRHHAETLKDRECVYQPTVIAGNKPICLGHNYSLLSAIPEAQVAGGASWSIPVSVERVTSFESKTDVGLHQVQRLLNDESLPWYEDLCVLVALGDYSHRHFLYPLSISRNRVIVTGCRANRVFYRLPDTNTAPQRGHPRWYGERFDLKDDTSWSPPDEYKTLSITTHLGRARTVTLRLWHDLLMKGSKSQPMHRHPFDLLQVELADPTSKPLFALLWLIVFGQERRQLRNCEAYQAYRQRFNLEHGIRFGKQHLLMTQLQTPDVTTEERWVQFSGLASAQLWAARTLVHSLPRPWQQYLPAYRQGLNSPSIVQRDFSRIIRSIGTPAQSVKPRGKSPGRRQGFTLNPRPKRPIVKRSSSPRKKRTKTA